MLICENKNNEDENDENNEEEVDESYKKHKIKPAVIHDNINESNNLIPCEKNDNKITNMPKNTDDNKSNNNKDDTLNFDSFIPENDQLNENSIRFIPSEYKPK